MGAFIKKHWVVIVLSLGGVLLAYWLYTQYAANAANSSAADQAAADQASLLASEQTPYLLSGSASSPVDSSSPSGSGLMNVLGTTPTPSPAGSTTATPGTTSTTGAAPGATASTPTTASNEEVAAGMVGASYQGQYVGQIPLAAAGSGQAVQLGNGLVSTYGLNGAPIPGSNPVINLQTPTPLDTSSLAAAGINPNDLEFDVYAGGYVDQSTGAYVYQYGGTPAGQQPNTTVAASGGQYVNGVFVPNGTNPTVTTLPTNPAVTPTPPVPPATPVNVGPVTLNSSTPRPITTTSNNLLSSAGISKTLTGGLGSSTAVKLPSVTTFKPRPINAGAPR